MKWKYIVIYSKTWNFVLSLYCTSLLHTDRQYILSVCSLFINLKGTSKLTSFQTRVFRVEGFWRVSKLHNSLFSMWYLFYRLLVLMYLYLVFQRSISEFSFMFSFVCLSRFCRTRVRVYYVQRLKIQSTNICERKCLWWQFRSRERCRLKSVLLDLCCTYYTVLLISSHTSLF